MISNWTRHYFHQNFTILLCPDRQFFQQLSHQRSEPFVSPWNSGGWVYFDHLIRFSSNIYLKFPSLIQGTIHKCQQALVGYVWPKIGWISVQLLFNILGMLISTQEYMIFISTKQGYLKICLLQHDDYFTGINFIRRGQVNYFCWIVVLWFHYKIQQRQTIYIMNSAQKVYSAVSLIPVGKISTYGKIAEFIGHPKAARMVGKVLHMNPNPQKIKCHRIVFKDGSLSQNFAFGGIQKQAQLLKSQGIELDPKNMRVKNLQSYLFNFQELSNQ